MRVSPGVVLVFSAACGGDPDPTDRVAEVHMNAYRVCLFSEGGQVYCTLYEAEGKTYTDPPQGSRYTMISAGAYHTCGLTRDEGKVECWGANTSGQMDTGPREGWPTKPGIPEGRYATIAAGAYHTCVLDSAGSPTCWGYNLDGEADTPPGATYAQIAPGDEYTCVRDGAGAISCWGRDVVGQINPPAGNFTRVIIEGTGNAAQKADGLWAWWGRDIGVAPDEPFVDVSASQFHGCGLRADGTVTCWGDNTWGELNVPADERFIQISSGRASTCGVTEDRRVVCWGCGTDGMYPDGHTFCQDPVPPW